LGSLAAGSRTGIHGSEEKGVLSRGCLGSAFVGRRQLGRRRWSKVSSGAVLEDTPAQRDVGKGKERALRGFKLLSVKRIT
jgi:hypothetical protein